MGEIFLKLLNMSITASWIILAVLGIRLLFRRIPKWISCLLWGDSSNPTDISVFHRKYI